MTVDYLTDGQAPNTANFYPKANAVLEPYTGIKQEIHRIICGPRRSAWNADNAQEFGRLAQGVKNNGKGDTNTIHFIP